MGAGLPGVRGALPELPLGFQGQPGQPRLLSFVPERGSPQAALSPSGVESLWAELSTKLPDRVSVSEVSLPCFPPLALSPGHTAQTLQPWGAFLSRGCGVMALGGSWPVWHGSASPSTLSPALSTLFSSLSEGDCHLDTCRIPEVPRYRRSHLWAVSVPSSKQVTMCLPPPPTPTPQSLSCEICHGGRRGRGGCGPALGFPPLNKAGHEDLSRNELDHRKDLQCTRREERDMGGSLTSAVS